MHEIRVDPDPPAPHDPTAWTLTVNRRNTVDGYHYTAARLDRGPLTLDTAVSWTRPIHLPRDTTPRTAGWAVARLADVGQLDTPLPTGPTANFTALDQPPGWRDWWVWTPHRMWLAPWSQRVPITPAYHHHRVTGGPVVAWTDDPDHHEPEFVVVRGARHLADLPPHTPLPAGPHGMTGGPTRHQIIAAIQTDGVTEVQAIAAALRVERHAVGRIVRSFGRW